MNVEAWEEELKTFGLLNKYLYLIDGFTEGFHQGIPNHTIGKLPWYSPPNRRSAIEARDKIEENIKKEVAKGRMKGPFSQDEV